MKNKTLIIYMSLILMFLGASILTAGSKFVSKDVEYKDGDTVLEGYVVYDPVRAGKAPGVIIVHEWNGLGHYVKGRAMQLAELGYQVFCADIYGKGIRPATMEESGKEAGKYRADRPLMRSRVNAALAEFRKMNIADNSRIAAMGYCFGGGVALELARSGADILGTVTFHGNLDTPVLAKPGDIKAKVLVLHGAEDPYTSWDKIKIFQDEMRGADVDWQMNFYSKAVHGFTNPDNGSNTTTGLAYNKEADMRSWEAMKSFFKEIFEKKETIK